MSNLDLIRFGGSVKRYHTATTIGAQSVAEHSFRVACICYLLDPECSKQQLLHALVHDLAEQVTGDIPAPAKRLLRTEELGRLEAKVTNSLLSTKLLPYQEKILKYADYLEGMLYCVEQRALGNRTMEQVFSNYQDYLVDIGALDNERVRDIYLDLLKEWDSYGR